MNYNVNLLRVLYCTVQSCTCRIKVMIMLEFMVVTIPTTSALFFSSFRRSYDTNIY